MPSPAETLTQGPGASHFPVFLRRLHSSAWTLGLSWAGLGERRLGLLSSLCCVVLGMLLIIFACQFSHQPNGDNNKASAHVAVGIVLEVMCR